MNNQHKAIAVVVAVLIIGFIVYSSGNKGAPSQAQVTASVTTLEKTLLITRTGESEGTEVEKSGEAKEGDTLKTLATGRALVQSSNGTNTLLDYDSSLTITAADKSGTHTSNFLNSGTVIAQVKQVFGNGEFYEVETQNAVAIVRGTKIEVSYRGADTTLLVHEGTVSFVPVDPSTRERHAEKAVQVTVGMKGVMGANGAATVSAMTEAEKNGAFYTYSLNVAAKAEAPSADAGTGAGKGSIRSLLAAGRDMACNFNVIQGDVSVEAKVFISGTNMYADYTMQGEEGAAISSHVVRTGNDFYMWSGTQGTKMTMDIDSATAPAAGAGSASGVNLDQEFDYNCTPWQKDASKFIPPSGVTFTDLSAMMKAQMNGGVR